LVRVRNLHKNDSQIGRARSGNSKAVVNLGQELEP
jgi:hypothetical protein